MTCTKGFYPKILHRPRVKIFIIIPIEILQKRRKILHILNQSTCWCTVKRRLIGDVVNILTLIISSLNVIDSVELPVFSLSKGSLVHFLMDLSRFKTFLVTKKARKWDLWMNMENLAGAWKGEFSRDWIFFFVKKQPKLKGKWDTNASKSPLLRRYVNLPWGPRYFFLTIFGYRNFSWEYFGFRNFNENFLGSGIFLWIFRLHGFFFVNF